MTAERITSRQNPLLRHVKKLINSKSYRDACREYVGDGTKLLQEAVKWSPGLHTVIASDNVEICVLPESVRVVRVPSDVMESISPMKTPQGALFLVKMPEKTPLAFHDGGIILDGIQDPGNLGTILRTADALEVPVVLADGCADPYSPKTVRASMGAVFRTQPQIFTRNEIVAYCSEHRIKLTATALAERSQDIRQADLRKTAVIIGSEGQGICEEFLRLAEETVIIPMSPRCESLNAAIAAAIVMWQMKQL